MTEGLRKADLSKLADTIDHKAEELWHDASKMPEAGKHIIEDTRKGSYQEIIMEANFLHGVAEGIKIAMGKERVDFGYTTLKVEELLK